MNQVVLILLFGVHYFSCEKLTVHIIPHSHDDVGWIRTIHEYYYHQFNYRGSVKSIIDTYIQSLLKDDNRKFIQVEIAFFEIWWNQQNDHLKEQVKQLVLKGQLQFAGGGWCMNDEATTYYEDIIDQMTLGHKFLIDHFDYKPNIGWQIDPFGHSLTMMNFMKQMGFNAVFFPRIDYQDKKRRMQFQEMEMVLHTSKFIDDPIFIHINYHHYEAPPGFDFDVSSLDQRIIDDETNKKYNIQEKSHQLVHYFRHQNNHYLGNIIMHTFGSDFEWARSEEYFENLDKIIKYINNNYDDIELKYSTPSDYIKEMHRQNIQYPTKSDDFFPYADEAGSFWTGYFTSRTAFKGMIKSVGRQIQIFRKSILMWIINGGNDYLTINKHEVLHSLKETEKALAVCQHHDAVTGTSKQYVVEDYKKILTQSFEETNNQMKKFLKEIIEKETSEEIKEIFTYNRNLSHWHELQEALEANKIVQINLLDGKNNFDGKKDVIKLKVARIPLKIIDQDNQLIEGDIFCFHQNVHEPCELIFEYTIKSTNFLQYFKLIPINLDHDQASAHIIHKYKNLILNDQIQFDTGKSFQLHYQYYKSEQAVFSQKSGMYIFKPSKGGNQPDEYGDLFSKHYYKGEKFEVIRLHSSHIITTVWKSIYENTYDIESFVESIPIHTFGKEVIMQIDTDIKNDDVFYTDSNGLELQERKINFRPSWDLTITDQIAGNYYPINGMIMIKDKNGNAAVLLNDRSQGGTSLEEGQIEIMLHRRVLFDDGRGVGESLDEKEHGKGLTQRLFHRLSFFNINEEKNWHRNLQYQEDLKPIEYITISTKQYFEEILSIKKELKPSISSLIYQKGQNIKTYLYEWKPDQYIFRIQNFKETGNEKFFIDQNFQYEERTLTANQNLEEWKEQQLKWQYKDTDDSKVQDNDENYEQMILRPLQIRTFLMRI